MYCQRLVCSAFQLNIVYRMETATIPYTSSATFLQTRYFFAINMQISWQVYNVNTSSTIYDQKDECPNTQNTTLRPSESTS